MKIHEEIRVVVRRRGVGCPAPPGSAKGEASQMNTPQETTGAFIRDASPFAQPGGAGHPTPRLLTTTRISSWIFMELHGGNPLKSDR